jgi:hypothetical protein
MKFIATKTQNRSIAGALHRLREPAQEVACSLACRRWKLSG